MALWLDDNLSQLDRWDDMSPTARACLIELWLYCRRAKNNGTIRNSKLKKASELLTPKVQNELVEQRWLHLNGTGCGTDTCPRGVPGVAIMHDYLQHQESAADMTARIETGRERSRKANHKRWHVDGKRHDPTCSLCTEGATA
jgi:hypothetical protein